MTLDSTITWPNLNDLWVREFRPLFQRLDFPLLESLQGTHRGEVVGPRWVRRLAPVAFALGGLGGWWGKRFDEAGNGVNIVLKGGRQVEVMPVQVVLRPSQVDGKACLAILYPPATSPWPMTRIMDEIRQLDDHRLLGLAIIQQRGLRRFPLPFVLHRN